MTVPSTLLVDADDTLWENIAVFNAINRAYVEWLLPGRTVEEMQADLDAHQVEMISVHGYGRHTFHQSLISGVGRFGGRPITDADEQWLQQLVEPLRWDTLDLRAGVVDTLEVLASRHRLLLVTKGEPEEQSHKVERSGLAPFFEQVEILDTKASGEYQELIERHSLDRATTWMIGNSPRSDIAPALEVGLGAVFIPHPETWSHEHAEVTAHPRLLQLQEFAELLEHF